MDELGDNPGGLGEPIGPNSATPAELPSTNPVDEIMAYILETPENTNPNVLRGILEKYFNQNGKEEVLGDKPGISDDVDDGGK